MSVTCFSRPRLAVMITLQVDERANLVVYMTSALSCRERKLAFPALTEYSCRPRSARYWQSLASADWQTSSDYCSLVMADAVLSRTYRRRQTWLSLLLARLHIMWEGQTSDGRWRLSSSCVTPAHMQRNSPAATRDDGPVVLRPVRATPCYY